MKPHIYQTDAVRVKLGRNVSAGLREDKTGRFDFTANGTPLKLFHRMPSFCDTILC